MNLNNHPEKRKPNSDEKKIIKLMLNQKFLKLYDFVGDANKEEFESFFNNIFEDEIKNDKNKEINLQPEPK